MTLHRRAPRRQGVIGSACYRRWCGGASSRSQSSLDARRIRSLVAEPVQVLGRDVHLRRFRLGRGGGSASMVVIVSL